jgi:hypothetical protein
MFSKLLEHGTYMSNFLTYRIAADKIEVFSVQKLDVSLPLASVDICALQILTAESESGREPSITSLPIATHCRACLGISGMTGNEGYWGGGISIISQNFPKSPSIPFYQLESSISQTSP